MTCALALNPENYKKMKKQSAFKTLILIGFGLINSSAFGQFYGMGGFGIGWGYFPYQDLTLGTVSLTGDFDYSGIIDGSDASQKENVKRNPPGLVVGSSELARVDLSVIPNASRQSDNKGVGSPKLKFLFHKTAVTLDLRPVNLASRRGRFASFEEEQSRSGRVLVWLDAGRKNLLLDSADLQRRRVEWPQSSSLPPRHVYVEGVAPGDSGTVILLTLLLDDNNLAPVADKFFGEKASWDSLFLSVSPKTIGFTKPYFDKSPAWVSLSGGWK